MEHATQKNKVLVNFTGRLLNGRVVDSSVNRGAVELQLGDGTVLPGLERAIIGMRTGESKSTLLRANEAFGARRTELVFKLDPGTLPQGVSPQVGEVLTMRNDQGAALAVQVARVTPEEVVLDGNHPLAGHDLTFDIELIRILDAAPPN